MKSDNWIQTYTGKKFYFNDPTPDQIDIVDIAHALSNICRFGGHCKSFYSVAQHSITLSDLFIDEDLALWALLDDASEAYIGDMVRPVKQYISYYVEIENKIMECIIKGFDLNPKRRPREIEIEDARLLIAERNDLMEGPPEPWIEEKYLPLLDVEIAYWDSSGSAEMRFLKRFCDLTEENFAELAERSLRYKR